MMSVIGPGPMSTTVQNFTPIGLTVAEISVTGQIDGKKHTKNYSRLNIRRIAYQRCVYR